MGTHTNGDSAAEPTRRIMDSIRRIVHVLRVSSRQAERRVGLSGAQLFVLQRLGAGGPLSINELAQRTRTHQSSVSVVVRRLAELNLVDRVNDPRDGRRVELSLTATGRRLVKRAPGAAQDRLLEAVGKLPAPRRRRLADLLNEIVRRMEESDAGAKRAPGMFFEDAPGRSAGVLAGELIEEADEDVRDR